MPSSIAIPKHYRIHFEFQNGILPSKFLCLYKYSCTSTLYGETERAKSAKKSSVSGLLEEFRQHNKFRKCDATDTPCLVNSDATDTHFAEFSAMPPTP
jgi:hypothetical protein